MVLAHRTKSHLRPWLIALGLFLVGCEADPQRAMGTLEWDRVNGRAIASETIIALHAKEGDAVKRGQQLLQLDPSLQQARVLQTHATIEQLQWQLQELESGYRVEEIAAAKASHEANVSTRNNRELEYQRQQKLREKNLTSDANVERARTRLDQAIGQEEASLEQLTQLQRGYRSETIAQAKAQLEAEQAALEYQQTLLNRYTVVAERDGVLESYPFKLGDKPPAGAVVTTVLSGAKPWARVYIPQPWLSQINVGAAVDVFVDGDNTPLEGTVRHIESRPSFTPYFALAEEDRQRLTFVTQIDLPGERAHQLPVGIPVQVGLRTTP